MGDTTAVVSNQPFKSNVEDKFRFALGPNEAEVIVHAEGRQTGLALSLAEHTWVAGDAGGMHRHGLEDEGFYVLEGEVTVTMPEEGETFVAKAGEFVWHPRGGAHDYQVSAGGQARVLQILVPGTPLMPNFFKALGDGTAPAVEAPEDLAKLAQWTTENYSVSFVAPPGA
jgi:quercetin dioxygenase-like cupin family protein